MRSSERATAVNSYPKWIVVSHSGRLPTPPQYRHTPIEKLFRTGKIGGTKREEFQSVSFQEAQEHAFAAERAGKRVEFLKVPRPGGQRHLCNWWRVGSHEKISETT